MFTGLDQDTVYCSIQLNDFISYLNVMLSLYCFFIRIGFVLVILFARISFNYHIFKKQIVVNDLIKIGHVKYGKPSVFSDLLMFQIKLNLQYMCVCVLFFVS